MKIIDTHCHPYLNKEKDKEVIIKNFFENGWEYMIVIWTDMKSSKTALEISNSNDRIFATVWIHPCDVFDLDLQESIKKISDYIENNREKIVAIWECWLDYYRILRDEKIEKMEEYQKEKAIKLKKELQALFFKAQIELAKKYDLPIIIHNRESRDDVLSILKETWFKKFVFHCYSEDLEYAKKLIDFSSECKLSFSWIVTFKNAIWVQDTARNIDIKYILSETDSPYLTPTPFRWKEENEPIFTKYVIEHIAKIRWDKLDIFSETIYNNAVDFFKIKK